jgi:outer membrane protein OmpA-like peptidoglycan-associated protein
MPKDAGGMFLRVGEKGRIEVLARPPAAPGVGNVGVGFRCENGKCTFVGGKDPSDLSNRTYTPQEAIDLLKGDKPGTTTPGKCPPDRVMGGLGFCCPFGTSWDAAENACVPTTTIPLCPPGQMTPLGTCCPKGEEWNYLLKRCQPGGTTTPTFPTLPPLSPGPLKRERPTFRFGTIESATYDEFVTDDATVPAQHSASLDHLADLLNIYKEVEVHIEGHTDSTADDAHNDKLAKRRGEAIRDALVARKVTDPSRLKVKGLGERQLRVDPERSDADRAANRRVEVWFHIKPLESPSRP